MSSDILKDKERPIFQNIGNFRDHSFNFTEFGGAKASKFMEETHLNLKSHWPLTFFSSLSAVCNLTLPLVLARTFTPAQMGEYKIFFLYLSLMPWIALTAGIGNGLYYWVNQKEFKKYFQMSWTLLFWWASVVAVLALLFLKDRMLGSWFALGTFLILLSNFHEESLIATGLTWRGALFSSVSEIVRSGLVITVAVLTHQLEWMVQAYVGVLLVKVLIGMYFGKQFQLQKLINPLLQNQQISMQVLRYGIPVSFASLIAVFTHFADQLVLIHFTDASYFAGYTLGCLTIPPLNSFEQAVNRVLIPSLTEKKPELFKRSISELTWIFIPATVGLIVFAQPIITLIFTDRYSWTAPFLRLYAINYLFLAFPYDAWARARGDGRWILKNLLLAVAVAVVTIPLFSYLYQGMGALIGLLCTQASLRVGGYFHIRKTTAWRITDFIPFNDIVYQSMLCLILTILSVVVGQVSGFGIKWFLICGPLFAAIYLAITCKRRFKIHFKSRQTLVVMHLTQYLEMGGLERIIQSLCNYNQLHSIETWVASYDLRAQAHSLKPNFEEMGVNVFSYQKKNGFSFKFLVKLMKLLYQNRIALIHTHDLGPLVYASIAKIILFGNIKIIHTQHSFIHLSKKARHRFYERLFTCFAAKVVVISESAREMYVSLGLNPGKIELIQNGASFPAAVPHSEVQKQEMRKELAPELDSRRCWILYLARINAQKGQSHALSLLFELPQEIKDKVLLVFVGQESSHGELVLLQNKINDLKLASQVAFVGMSTEPMKWLAVSDVYLSLSEFEGMPLSPIEALGAALPVVLSDIPGHAMFPSECLRLSLSISTSDCAAFKVFLEDIIKKPQIERASAFDVASDWRSQNGIENMARQYLKLYQMVNS